MLESARRIEVLVTRVQFPEGMPHGFALALMARRMRPGVKVLFTAQPNLAGFTDGVGELLIAPVTPDDVVTKVANIVSKSV